MSAKCPQNDSNAAIVCLLRLLADNAGGYNWDPVTFGFTAAIGVLAFLVACVTVFQGLLAAGPGRTKASKLAIGSFAQHTEHRFDRTELALRTTARVPFITWDVLYNKVVRKEYNGTLPGVEKGLPFYQRLGGKPTNADEGRHQSDSTASWLTLLSAVRLDDPTLFPLVQRATDYVPADINCAPAAAELRCLAILAVVADTNATIEKAGPGDRFVRVSADSSQLVFRDHPSLGTIAAYEAYQETTILKAGGDSSPVEFGGQFPQMSYRDLGRCLEFASGRLVYAGGRISRNLDMQADEQSFLTLIADLQKRSGDCGHAVCKYAFQAWKMRVDNSLDGIGLSQFYMDNVYSAISLMVADRGNICKGFPRKRIGLHVATKGIIALNKFWSTEWTGSQAVQLNRLATTTFWQAAHISQATHLSPTWVVDSNNMQSTVTNACKGSTHSLEAASSYRVVNIRNYMQSLQRPGDEDIALRRDALEGIKQFLACLDEWLLRHGGPHASCTMLQLLHEIGRKWWKVAETDRSHDQVDDLTDILTVLGWIQRSSQNNEVGHQQKPPAETSRSPDQDDNLTAILQAIEQIQWSSRNNEDGRQQKPPAETSRGQDQDDYLTDFQNLINEHPALKWYQWSSQNNEAVVDQTATLERVKPAIMPILLILRGILYSMLLESGTDTSVLYDPKFQNVVVRMI